MKREDWTEWNYTPPGLLIFMAVGLGLVAIGIVALFAFMLVGVMG